MFCVQIKESVMFVIADQGRFNVLVYRSRMVSCFLDAEQ